MPPKRTDAVIEKIIDGLSRGITMTEICREENMPAPRTVREWAENDEQLSAAIARARELGFDAIAEEALRIADTPVEGKRIKRSEDGMEEVVEDMLGHRKLQVETRLKLLAKWDPKRYGELVKLGNPDGSNLDLAGTIAARRAKVAQGE
jgi:hypothetical protein